MACISGFTLGGYYNYIDCCGIEQTGISFGLQDVCVDATYSGSTTGVLLDSGSTCTINCNQGPLNYTFTITGTCGNPYGEINITPFGGTPTYTLDNIYPGTLSTQYGLGPFYFSGLSADTYTFRLNDSLALQNNEIYLNVLVSDCFTSDIISVSGTTCGGDNGSLEIDNTPRTGGPYNIVLYKDSAYYDLVTTNNLPYIFSSLPNGTYNAITYDAGNNSGITSNAVITSSVGVDFGFWKVNTSNCVINQGKLAVTGVTGTPPFTYLWDNGETTTLITGLTVGSYTCVVTDSLGCETIKSEVIGEANPMGIGLLSSVNPSCFSSDGSLTYTITGGTIPFYYSATTSQVGYTFSDTFTLTGLSTGNYIVEVRDANFCSQTFNGSVLSPGGFSVVDTIVTNSNCNQNNGSIYVELQGSSGNYVYSLSGQNTNQVYGTISQSQNYTFSSLPNDTFLLVISATSSSCVYSTNVNVDSVQKFDFSANTTGTTCGQQNGSINVVVSSGYTGMIDYVLHNVDNPLIGDITIPNSTLSSQTFNNLVYGNYVLSVTDDNGCTISKNISITTTPQMIATVSTTNCTGTNNGEATIYVLDGTPPFTYLWSNSSTGTTISNLSGGSYSVNVTDNSGCTQTYSFDIVCMTELVSNYQTYNICDNLFTTTTGTQRGFSEMLNEGYIDITSGYTGCSFNSAELTCEVTINGSAFTQTFYTATTLNDVPQDSLWQTTIEGILSTIPDVGDYEINLINNTLQIKSNCNGDDEPLSDASFSLGLQIVYDVVCYSP
jgi:hypothetical protein